MRIQSPSDTKVSIKGGTGGAWGAEQRLPCSLCCRLIMERQLCPCSPWRSMLKQIFTYRPWRTPCWSRWIPKGGCDPMWSLWWSRLLVRPVALWREESTLEQVCWRDLWPPWGPCRSNLPDCLYPMEGIHAGAAHEELQSMGWTHFVEDCAIVETWEVNEKWGWCLSVFCLNLHIDLE